MTMFEKAATSVASLIARKKDVRGDEIVRAVLEAIREPDEAMVSAANEHPGMCEPCDAEWVWGLMLDAILKGAK